MKTKILAILFLFSAFALADQSAYPVRVNYSVTPLTTASWVQLAASTGIVVQGAVISNSATQAVQVGIGTAGNEQTVMYIPPSSGPMLYPIEISNGKRIAIKAASTAISTGEGSFNFFTTK